MEDEATGAGSVSQEDQLDASRTLTGLPFPNDQLATRLQYVADLLADAKSLPSAPMLVWRESDRSVHHCAINQELVVGRQAGSAGLSLDQDKRMSRRHFVIRHADQGWMVTDLGSRNGTAVNSTEARLESRHLRDGDLILAGDHILAFLDPSRTE